MLIIQLPSAYVRTHHEDLGAVTYLLSSAPLGNRLQNGAVFAKLAILLVSLALSHLIPMLFSSVRGTNPPSTQDPHLSL